MRRSLSPSFPGCPKMSLSLQFKFCNNNSSKSKWSSNETVALRTRRQRLRGSRHIQGCALPQGLGQMLPAIHENTHTFWRDYRCYTGMCVTPEFGTNVTGNTKTRTHFGLITAVTQGSALPQSLGKMLPVTRENTHTFWFCYCCYRKGKPTDKFPPEGIHALFPPGDKCVLSPSGMLPLLLQGMLFLTTGDKRGLSLPPLGLCL